MEIIGKIMDYNIAIIFTTFYRDELMYRTVQSILDNWNENYVLLIGDQNYTENNDSKKDSFYKKIQMNNTKNIKVVALPYDCGLSYARNQLVKIAKYRDIQYCIITADSVNFTKKYDFTTIFSFLEKDVKNGIVGLDLANRQYWVYNIDLIPGQFFKLYKEGLKEIEYLNTKFIACEVVPNFFIAKTACLIENSWDNDLKLAEHEDFFWRLKKDTDYKVYWTNNIQAEYITDKSKEYLSFRQRLYSEFKGKLLNKYKIARWLKY